MKFRKKQLRNRSITLKAFAKINLSLDVIALRKDGYHELDMIMQQIDMHDLVNIRWYPNKGEKDFRIRIGSNLYYLPTDERNLAYKAALMMYEKFGRGLKGLLRIDMKKQIPVGAGLAGGSADGAAVIHGINQIWGLGLNLFNMKKLGFSLGADIPFAIIGQGKTDPVLSNIYGAEKDAGNCARAGGRGERLTPLRPLNSLLLLTKPSMSISTAEVYRGIDTVDIHARPDNDILEAFLREGGLDSAALNGNSANVLEEYVMKEKPAVEETKKMVREVCGDRYVQMSGSGPSIFGIFEDNRRALASSYKKIKKIYKETYVTKTTV